MDFLKLMVFRILMRYFSQQVSALDHNAALSLQDAT